jgi:uncharacterized coiled-coil protein SlyX
MGDEIIHKRHDNSKGGVDASAEAWRNFFLHAFDEAQANLLCEMLSRCVADWSKEWRGDIEDVGFAIQDVLFDQLDKAVKEAQTQRRAIDIMRAQMDVMIGRPVEGQVVDVPKFIEGKVVKSSNVVPDASIERLADLERQSARMERQIKTMAQGARTSGLVAKAMSQRLTKRVDRLEGRMTKVEEEVE